jgi:phage gp36-like protein
MAYSTQPDLVEQLSEAELIQLSDDAGIGIINAAVVIRAIADADEEINGYIGSRMAVPLTTVPGIIRKMSVEIAIYNLYARRQDSVPETRKDRYRNAVAFLVKVGEGKLSLGASDPTGSPPEGSAAWSGADQVMVSEKLERF